MTWIVDRRPVRLAPSWPIPRLGQARRIRTIARRMPRRPVAIGRPGTGPRTVGSDHWPVPGLSRARIARGGTMSVASKAPAIRRSIPHRRFRPISASLPIGSPGLYAGEPENCRRRPREFLCDHGATGADARGLRRLPARDPIVSDPRPAGDGGAAGPLPGALPLEEAALRGGLDPGDGPRQRPVHLGRRAGRLGGAPGPRRGAAPAGGSASD